MKVLLDENMPHNLRFCLGGHEVFTADYLGWAGVKNGALLSKCREASFEAFVTADRSLSFQQDMRQQALCFVVLSTNDWTLIKPRTEVVAEALKCCTPGAVIRIEI